MTGENEKRKQQREIDTYAEKHEKQENEKKQKPGNQEEEHGDVRLIELKSALCPKCRRVFTGVIKPVKDLPAFPEDNLCPVCTGKIQPTNLVVPTAAVGRKMRKRLVN